MQLERAHLQFEDPHPENHEVSGLHCKRNTQAEKTTETRTQRESPSLLCSRAVPRQVAAVDPNVQANVHACLKPEPVRLIVTSINLELNRV